MKKPIAIFALISISLFSFVPTRAADDGLPVWKNLVAELPVPWGENIPKSWDLLVFQCGRRIHIVWESNGSDFSGQKISRLFTILDGKAVKNFWQETVRDTANSKVRFTGTCVGDRAVIKNQWEDSASNTHGEMATSVNGEETFGPTWTNDGKTIFTWRKYGERALDIKFQDPHLTDLVIERNRAQVVGNVIRTRTGITGYSTNYMLGENGRVISYGAPWFKDIRSVLPKEKTFYVATFERLNNKWMVKESTIPDLAADLQHLAVSTSSSIRTDTQAIWRPFQEKTDLSARERCENDLLDNYSVLTTRNDGLVLRSSLCSAEGVLLLGSISRIHYAPEESTLKPRVYAADRATGLIGESIVYAVRTGDGKLQIWKAVVK